MGGRGREGRVGFDYGGFEMLMVVFFCSGELRRVFDKGGGLVKLVIEEILFFIVKGGVVWRKVENLEIR